MNTSTGTASTGLASTELAYTGLIALVGAERLAELAVARRNLAWARRHGGVEHGGRHYPLMVAAHAGLLAGALLEVRFRRRRFRPRLGWPMLALTASAQALRWWCIATLGKRWNTRVVVVPGMPLVDRGPYRRLRHPNYVAVVTEGVALPLVHGAWITALVFTSADLWLLRTRIRVEDRALGRTGDPPGGVTESAPPGRREPPRRAPVRR